MSTVAWVSSTAHLTCWPLWRKHRPSRFFRRPSRWTTALRRAAVRLRQTWSRTRRVQRPHRLWAPAPPQRRKAKHDQRIQGGGWILLTRGLRAGFEIHYGWSCSLTPFGRTTNWLFTVVFVVDIPRSWQSIMGCVLVENRDPQESSLQNTFGATTATEARDTEQLSGIVDFSFSVSCVFQYWFDHYLTQVIARRVIALFSVLSEVSFGMDPRCSVQTRISEKRASMVYNYIYCIYRTNNVG